MTFVNNRGGGLERASSKKNHSPNALKILPVSARKGDEQVGRTLFFDKCRGGTAYLYLISILMWPHFDTYPFISMQNILMRARNISTYYQNILMRRVSLRKYQKGELLEKYFLTFQIWKLSCRRSNCNAVNGV